MPDNDMLQGPVEAMRFLTAADGTQVVNMQAEWYDLRIDRASKWGNPFRIGRDGSRDEVVRKYALWITQGEGQRLLPHLGKLRGKRLGCWCAPQRCHGEVLVWLMNCKEGDVLPMEYGGTPLKLEEEG